MMYGQLDSNRVFEKSKGTWRIPIDRVSEISVPDLKDSGLSIACSPGAGGISFFTNYTSDVYSVCAGTVECVLCIGDIQAIIIKYGDYFVLYSGLSVCYVNKNEMVNAGSKIGRLNPYLQNELEVYLSFKSNRIDDMEKWYSKELIEFVNNSSKSSYNEY